MVHIMPIGAYILYAVVLLLLFLGVLSLVVSATKEISGDLKQRRLWRKLAANADLEGR
jgi:hypothetical protein